MKASENIASMVWLFSKEDSRRDEIQKLVFEVECLEAEAARYRALLPEHNEVHSRLSELIDTHVAGYTETMPLLGLVERLEKALKGRKRKL